MESLTGPDGFLTAEAVRRLHHRAVLRWNAGRCFDAHEDWEALWHEADGPRRAWLQGLIQFAAALHHFARGSAFGFQGLMRSAAPKAGGYGGDTGGIDFVALWADLQPWIAHAERVEKGADLKAGAPPSIPKIRFLPGVVPEPFPDPGPSEEERSAAEAGGGD